MYNPYGYDDIDRLTMVAYHNSDAEGFVMDDLGNRTGNQTLRGEGTVNFAVDTLTNRYTAVAGNPLAYDDAGNLTQDKDGYQFTYDFENRIIKVRNSSNALVAEFDYDTQGRRIRVYDAVADSTTLYYYSDNWQVLSTYVGGSLDKSFVFGNYIDEVLLMNDGTDDDYYLHDHLYSPVALLDGTGAVVERYEYDAYGSCRILDSNFDIRISSLYGNPYAFTGRELDTLDAGSCTLMHYRHRAYNTYAGRFMQRDPLDYIDGMNLYEYVRSDPLKYTDSSGLRVDATDYAACRAAGFSHEKCIVCCHVFYTDFEVSRDYRMTYSDEEANIIAKEEGYKAKVYRDTLGNRTIGYGTNLDRLGIQEAIQAIGLNYENLVKGRDSISKEDAKKLLTSDINAAWNSAKNVLGDECWASVWQETRDILTHMAYQLGGAGLAKFNKMKSALCDGCKPSYEEAADEMLNSTWAGQTPNRAKRLADRMRKSGPKSTPIKGE